MKRFLLSTLIVFNLGFSLLGQQHAETAWVKFTSENGRFSALLPEQPKEQTETIPSEHGPYISHLLVAKSGSNIFAIGWVDYDPSFNFKPLNELDANRDNFLKGVKATLVNSRNLILNGYQSLEFTAETAEATFKSRVFIVGRRPYQIVVRSDKGLEDPENTLRFFDSFTVKP